MSGNISSSISDHLPQISILPDFFLNSSPKKYNIIFENWENFNNQSFLDNSGKFNWNQVLQLNQNNVKITFKKYLNTVNALINCYAPLKKLNKKKRKFQPKTMDYKRNPKYN